MDIDYRRLSDTHGFSLEAVMVMARALRIGGGKAAQFDHPEFGGLGQWLPGMVMLSRPNDEALKARVASLIADLLKTKGDAAVDAAADRVGGMMDQLMAKMDSQMRKMDAAGLNDPTEQTWWPEALGTPSATGSQNDMRYAYFMATSRLAIWKGGKLTLYDTTGYRITGVSQQQQSGGESMIMVNTGRQTMPLESLRIVEA